jgi:Flp pilus assembly protein CpaB
VPAVTVRRRSSALPLVLAIFLIGFVLIVAGFFIYLAFGGEVTVPFTDPPRTLSFAQEKTEKPWSAPVGKTAIPRSARAIDPYSKVSRDDLWDLKNSRFAAVYVDPAQVSDDMITDVRDILGRVLSRKKSAGYAFTESDFMPKGTRSGLVAGIPPGMRAMRVPLSVVRGLYDLNPGDHFDLVSTVALESSAGDALKRMGGAHASKMAMEAEMNNISKQARVDIVVQNGLVVSAVQTVKIPIAAGNVHDPNGVKTKPVQEVVIAVLPTEVAQVTQALAVGATLTVIARSGHPDDDASSVTPSSRPWSPFSGADQDANADGTGRPSMHLVEQIGGKKREIVPVPNDAPKKDK